MVASHVFADDIEKRGLTIFSLFNIPFTVIATHPGSRVLHQSQKKYTRVCCLPFSRIDEVNAMCR